MLWTAIQAGTTPKGLFFFGGTEPASKNSRIT